MAEASQRNKMSSKNSFEEVIIKDSQLVVILK